MPTALDSALAELRTVGAQGLPTAAEVNAAPKGKSWFGKKTSGSSWSLTKNHADSYNTMC